MSQLEEDAKKLIAICHQGHVDDHERIEIATIAFMLGMQNGMSQKGQPAAVTDLMGKEIA